MSITYPLAFPGYSYVESVRWQSVDAAGVSQSPYTFQQQVYDYEAGMWTVDIDLRWLDREEAAPIIAFLNKLRGKVGTFTFADVITAECRGVATGSPKVKGAGQNGFTLITDGWTPSVTGILLESDKIGIGNSIHRVVNTVNSNASGEATLDIWPHLKNVADNTEIVTSKPKSIFRLNNGTQVSELIDKNKQFIISISADEAL